MLCEHVVGFVLAEFIERGAGSPYFAVSGDHASIRSQQCVRAPTRPDRHGGKPSVVRRPQGRDMLARGAVEHLRRNAALHQVEPRGGNQNRTHRRQRAAGVTLHNAGRDGLRAIATGPDIGTALSVETAQVGFDPRHERRGEVDVTASYRHIRANRPIGDQRPIIADQPSLLSDRTISPDFIA